MNKDIIRQASEQYAEKSFIHPLNQRGEPMSIPAGQSVPHGYRQHCKVAKRHFIKGVEWHAEMTAITTEIVEPTRHKCPFVSFMKWIEELISRIKRWVNYS